MSAFLTASDVVVRFGGLTAVDGVSLHADRGEVVGLIGPNGAGKSTMFGAILGTVPMRGHIALAGQDVTRWSSHRRARLGVARTFQKLESFGSLTVREGFSFATEARALGSHPWRLASVSAHCAPERVDATLDLLGLRAVADELEGSLPAGTRRVVEFGRALCSDPAMLLLDEPSSGLDDRESAELAAHVRAAVDDLDVGVLLVEHDMNLVLSLCDRVYVIEFGRLIAEGTTSEIQRDPAVRRAYLGGDSAA